MNVRWPALIVPGVQLRQLDRNPGFEMTDTTRVRGRAEYTSHLFWSNQSACIEKKIPAHIAGVFPVSLYSFSFFVFVSCLSLSLHLFFHSLFCLCILSFLVFFIFVSCLSLQLSSPWTLGCPAADPLPLQSCSKPQSPSQDHSVFKRFLHKIMAKCISGSFFPFSLHVCFFMQKYLFCSKPPSPSQDHSQALLLLQRFFLDHGKCIFGNCL